MDPVQSGAWSLMLKSRVESVVGRGLVVGRSQALRGFSRSVLLQRSRTVLGCLTVWCRPQSVEIGWVSHPSHSKESLLPCSTVYRLVYKGLDERSPHFLIISPGSLVFVSTTPLYSTTPLDSVNHSPTALARHFTTTPTTDPSSMMSYWHCVVRARAPVRGLPSPRIEERTPTSVWLTLQSLVLWGTLQAGIIYTIYSQKKRARYVPF